MVPQMEVPEGRQLVTGRLPTTYDGEARRSGRRRLTILGLAPAAQLLARQQV
jgi:hypothetical protein